MKLVRYGEKGQERPGMIDSEGNIRAIDALVDDIAGEGLSPRSLGKLSQTALNQLPLVQGAPRLGPCVGDVGNGIICR